MPMHVFDAMGSLTTILDCHRASRRYYFVALRYSSSIYCLFVCRMVFSLTAGRRCHNFSTGDPQIFAAGPRFVKFMHVPLP
jgi:hypothetical protein